MYLGQDMICKWLTYTLNRLRNHKLHLDSFGLSCCQLCLQSAVQHMAQSRSSGNLFECAWHVSQK